MLPILGACTAGSIWCCRPSGSWTLRLHLRIICRFYRKPGTEPCYLCGNTVRYGNHSPHSPISWRKRPERIGSVIGGAAVVFAVISAILFIVMIAFAHPISVLMQAPAEAVSLTTSYVRICGSGIFFIVAYNLLSAIFRGLGDSKSPLLFVLVACIVNIFGDLFLVAGLHLDAAGAALATVFAQAVSVGMCDRHPAEKKLPFPSKIRLMF